jgi:hypothetical protein
MRQARREEETNENWAAAKPLQQSNAADFHLIVKIYCNHCPRRSL